MNIETIRYFIVNNFITIALLITLFLIFIFRKKITDIIMKKVPDNYLMVLALFIICFVFVYYGFDFYHRNIINGDQLSYMGSIIGGGITLFGVYATIDHTNHLRKEDQKRHNQERKENLALQYKPYISLLPQKELEDRGINIKDCVKYDAKSNKYKFELIYQNIGYGEAENLTIQIYSANKKIYVSQKNCVSIFPDALLHRLQISTNSCGTSHNTKKYFEVLFIYNDSFSMYQYEKHYQIRYIIEKNQCISYSIRLDHESSKTQRIENQKSKNESEE